MQLSYEEMCDRKVEALRHKARQEFVMAASLFYERGHEVPVELERVAYDALVAWGERPEFRQAYDVMFGAVDEKPLPSEAQEAQEGWHLFRIHVQTKILPLFATR